MDKKQESLDELEQGIEKTAAESNDPKIKEAREHWALMLIKWKGVKLIFSALRDIILTITAAITGIMVTANFVMNKFLTMKATVRPKTVVAEGLHHMDMIPIDHSSSLSTSDVVQIVIVLVCLVYLFYRFIKWWRNRNDV